MAGPKTGVRGFGTGKGRAKGKRNKVPHAAKLLIARAVAGSLNENSLKLLAADNPALYRRVITCAPVKRALQLRKGVTQIRRVKDIAHYTDELTDAQVVAQHAAKNGMDPKGVGSLLHVLGPERIKVRASGLRHEMRLADMTPEQKSLMLVELYQSAKLHSPKRRSRRG